MLSDVLQKAIDMTERIIGWIVMADLLGSAIADLVEFVYLNE
jgi:hypothetical protein